MIGEMGPQIEGEPLESDHLNSQTVIDHATRPRNAGRIPNADGFARITGPCGDTMEISLRVRDGVIHQAAFWTDGCGTTIAAGSMVTELICRRAVEQALVVTQQAILEALGGLPEESAHCALLASNTLKSACRDYLALRKEPWKRAYRKG